MKSSAQSALPRQARQALKKLGADIRIARRKRRMPTASLAERAFISRGTLYKVEQGDPSVSMGIYASVISILGFAGRLGDVVDREADAVGLDIDEAHLPKKIHTKRKQP